MSCLFYWLCDVYEVLIDGSCLDMPSREVSTLEQGKESYRLWSPRSSRRPCVWAARGLKRNEIARSWFRDLQWQRLLCPALLRARNKGLHANHVRLLHCSSSFLFRVKRSILQGTTWRTLFLSGKSASEAGTDCRIRISAKPCPKI